MPKSYEYDLIKMSESDDFEDISSNFADVSSSSRKKPSKKKKPRKKHPVLKIFCIILSIIIVAGLGFYFYAYNLIDSVPRDELNKDDLGISSSNYSDVKNIALLGIDARKDTDSGRSDAIIILTVDKKHKKIKLTSIARDTLVAIDGHGNDKLTHAYAYGKSQLTVKTLNQNFGLEITDYVTMNFFEFAKAVDYVGVVTIDIDKKEMRDLNTNIIPKLRKMGIECELIKTSGVQHLSGAQALCYSRIRKVDSDVMRGNRQKEVITAVFDKVKTMGVAKLPKLVDMVLSECSTSLPTEEIMSLGVWALTSGMNFEQLSIPNDNISSSGRIVSGRWCYVIDLEQAKTEIYDFIHELNYYSPEEKALREKEENKK